MILSFGKCCVNKTGFNVQADELGTPAAGATHLIVVTDWRKDIDESNEGNNVRGIRDVALALNSGVPDVLASHSRTVIKEMLRASGEALAFVSSTIRTPSGQANAMFNNLLNGNKVKYGKFGKMVEKVYKDLVSDKKDPKDPNDPNDKKVIIDAMTAKLNEVTKSGVKLCELVSNHCVSQAEYDKLNVLDLRPSTFDSDASRQRFVKEMSSAKKAGEVSACGAPDGIRSGTQCFRDPAFHLEIPVPQPLSTDGVRQSPGSLLVSQDVDEYSVFGFLERLLPDNFVAEISDLPSRQLGEAANGVVTLDADGNGAGWYIDPTPKDHSEFTQLADGSLVASPGSPAYGRYDLLTVVLHELGHLEGHGHTDDGLMAATLPLGTRRLPDEGTFDFEPAPQRDEELPGMPFVGTIDSSVGLPDLLTQQSVTDEAEIVAGAELPVFPVPYLAEPTSYEILYDDRSRVETDEHDELFGELDGDWLLFDPEDWLNQV